MGQPVDEHTAVKPATKYRLSFSLLNTDPAVIRPDWDIEHAIAGDTSTIELYKNFR